MALTYLEVLSVYTV